MKHYLAIAAVAMLLTGCVTAPQTIYYNGGYSSAVYQYLKNDEMSIEEQIGILETIIEQAANEGKPVLPGVHAHLGLLYFDSGNPGLGTNHFETEKQLFPESVSYIDFLLKNNQQGS